MHNRQEQILLGVRISSRLKERLFNYCRSHGIKMNFLVSEAIREKLLDICEEDKDITIADARFKDAEFVSQKEFNKHLSRRHLYGKSGTKKKGKKP